MSTLRVMAVEEICQRGSVRDSDVAMLRNNLARATLIGPSAIDSLLRINSQARIQDPSWPDFFVGIVTDYVVRELEPSGYVTAAHAGWLIARVSTAGRVHSKTEHDLLLNVIDKARWVPESLLTYTLTQIRDAVLTGQGPLRVGGMLAPATLTMTEIEQVRRILFAYGTEGPATITQAEIAILLEIDSALGAEPHHLFATEVEAWRDLLIKAVASAILGASGYVPASREQALQEKAPLTATYGGADVRIGLVRSGVLDSYRAVPPEARALARLERQRIEIITGEPITEAKPEQLALAVAQHRGSARLDGLVESLVGAGFDLHPAFTALAHSAVAAA